MNHVTLYDLYSHPIAKKFIKRSGLDHAISTAESAFYFACKSQVHPELAVKAAFLHDIGHYTWYGEDGEWNFHSYKENDIHAIKGAERAHKLLIRLGEDRKSAKEIALAILLHTDSYLPSGDLQLTPLQMVVSQADEANEEPDGLHHYRMIDEKEALQRIRGLDELVQQTSRAYEKQSS